MNNKLPLQPHEIEKRLQKSTPVVLSAGEKADLKSSLMAYADFHQSSPVSAKQVPMTLAWRRFVGAFAVVVLCVTTSGAFAHQSLPGEPLYQFKLDVVEPIVMRVQYPALDTMSQQTKLMEFRLAEVQKLKTEGDLSAKVSSEILENLTEYSQVLAEGVNNPTTETLRTIDTAIALINAHNALFETSSTSATSSPFDELSQDLEEAQTEQIDTLVSQSDSDTISDYIDESVANIQENISNKSYASTTLEKVGYSIDQAADSLTLESLEDTQEHIAEVNQLILTEDFLKMKE